MKNVPLGLLASLAIATAACGGASPTQPAAPTTTVASAPAPTSTPTPPSTSTSTSPPTSASTSTPPADPPAPKTPAAGYRWEVHTPTGMEFEVPTDWKKHAEGDVMLIASPTPGAVIEFVGATGGTTAAADEREILGALGRTLENAKLTSPARPATQHGLRGWAATGSGKKNGKDILFLTSGVGDGHGHELLATALYDATITPAVKEQIVHVLDSIQSVDR